MKIEIEDNLKKIRDITEEMKEQLNMVKQVEWIKEDKHILKFHNIGEDIKVDERCPLCKEMATLVKRTRPYIKEGEEKEILEGGIVNKDVDYFQWEKFVCKECGISFIEKREIKQS